MAGTTGASGGHASGGASASGGAPATGGVTGSGGHTGGAGGGTSCPGGTLCGGDLVGTWTVKSSCLTVTGSLDPSAYNLDCSSAPVTGSLQVTGTFTIKPDGTYADNTVTSGTERFTLAPSCLVISSTPVKCDQAANIMLSLGFASVTCTAATGGGCDCTGNVQQNGGLGFVSATVDGSGKVESSGNVATLTGDLNLAEAPYSYCVSGGNLTVTPQSTSPTVSGAVVLTKQSGGAGGAGGAGTGGRAGSGGSGGSSATGGRTGSGGSNAAGGSTGTGGSATGGRSGSGGTGGGSSATGGSGSGGSTGGSTGTAGPCDVLAAANAPCVAAHSTVRAMFAGYGKALYQVKKVSDGSTKDIALAAGSNIADAAAQDAFCGTAARACTISIIYDQTGNGNDLKVAQMCSTCSGCPSDASKKGQPDIEAFADGARTTIAGHPAYGVRILPCGGGIPNQTGYRSTAAKNTATGDQPESVYFVVDGVNTNSGCCFDYGNANPNGTASGNMNAVEFSKNKFWGYGAGSGPWVAADLEAGVYSWNGASGNWMNPNSQSLPYPFVTALLKNNQNGKTADEGPFVLKGGNAQSGTLTTMWSGARPNGYQTMDKKGGIVLGIGGDGAAGAQGSFFEGAMTATFTSKAADDALQANILAAGYGK